MSQVDPRAPRFGQAITATLALVAAGLREPLVLYALATLLLVPVVSRWRIDPYGFLWRRVVRRVLDPPESTESALPHRFARLVGATLTAVASILLVLESVAGFGALALLAYGLALVVGLLAALGATTGVCLGCRTYRQVSVVRDLGLLTSPRERTTRR